MVDFWSTWCPPCQREAPTLKEVYDEYRGRGVEFVGVAIWDQRNDVTEFVEQVGADYLLALDDRGLAAVEYGVRGIPEKYFIGPDGTLMRKYIGPMEADDLRRILDNLLPAG
jgi:cytochrome c biogenesis protein CcmG/thiol:disulfide interchange protein DsbE